MIDVSDFVFYSGIIFSFQSGCGRFIIQISESYKSTLFIDQLLDFLVSDNENKSKNLLYISPKSKKLGTIEFHNVTFRYPGSVHNTLNKINLKMGIGEKVGIIGENGCGKSTLINLLLRYYLPTEGYISLDGIDIQKYNLKEYRKLFSGIYQDFQKFAVSIDEFISFGNMPNLGNIKKLKLSAKKAMISNFIEVSPYKYKRQLTQLFDQYGLELSGGQWQRLANSRVFFLIRQYLFLMNLLPL